MEEKFELLIDGFPIIEQRLAWSHDYQHWYLLYYDAKYLSQWESFATIEYQKDSNIMTYKSRFGFSQEDYNGKNEMIDAEQRFKKFMELYLEENKFYFLLNRPEGL
ncbi:hypothetical protein [Priestia aryabhattai]|uniref:hypothetical protein n=1 Tax=Priestia aryabhattai TaxID=412384 RepID=UPI002E2472B4|nr:hypothetical protein [Priestia aryabhattai]